MASKERWTVGGADPSGNSWDIFKTASPFEALKKLNALRDDAREKGLARVRTFYVYDAEEPERGDAEMLLEEMLDEEREAAEQEAEMARRDYLWLRDVHVPDASGYPGGEDFPGVARNVYTSPREPQEDFDDTDPAGIES